MTQMFAHLGGWVRELTDLLFGYDFFISYAHSDGIHYPRSLADQLQAAGFKVFLDSRVYVAGDDLRRATRRRIRMSKKLVVIMRPNALSSNWMLTEVNACLAAGRTPIVIDINATLQEAPEDSEIGTLLRDKLFIAEELDDIDGQPADRIVKDLNRSFQSTRQDVVRLRVVCCAALVLTAAAIMAAWQYGRAERRALQAREQLALKYVANAERQLFQNPQESLLLGAQALSESDSEHAIQAATTAVQEALRIIRKRQEIQEDDTWGSNLFQSYIAGAWFEADLNARYSKGGDQILLTTERGMTGNNPPGDAFVLATDTLNMKELGIGPAWGTKRVSSGEIVKFTVKSDAGPGRVPFVCTVHTKERSAFKIGKTSASTTRITARESDDGPHWAGVDNAWRGGGADVRPGQTVTVEIESGEHGLTFLDKGQALNVFDFETPPDRFEYQPRVKTRDGLRRRLEFVGFSASRKKIYLSRQYNVEVYSARGDFQKEFKTGGGCTKYPISVVNGVLDDQFIVYGDTDGGVYLLEYSTGKCKLIQRRPGYILIKFDLSPSGQFAALVFKNRNAAIWRVSGLDSIQRPIPAPHDKVLVALFRPLGPEQLLLTAGEGGHVGLWEIDEDQFVPLRSFDHDGDSIGFAAFAADGNSFVTVAESGMIRKWDLKTGRLLKSITTDGAGTDKGDAPDAT